MAETRYKVGDLVRVRDDAGTLHYQNEEFEGQLGVVFELGEYTDYPHNVRFLSTGREWVFCDEELNDAPQP